MNILFICTGNTCRSPMAEAILKNKKLDDIKVRSAGIFASNGSNAAENALKVLQENNIHHQHTSKMLTQEDIIWADYIFTMTEGHKELIVDQHPFIADKTFTLKEFVYNSKIDTDVSDPYGGNVDVYRETYKELEELIKEMLKKI
ncbi:low molecular weight protein arginine phosphatase [Bacillus sp. FJAT-49736]|uniref:low molecular weight protein arginine phosphatase n=1 Tax=Bacillus sp. FJAT-49736 TaxID=2833582 RepID=UPI001BCA4939|nr:low molecular weight protein arginine phosphatase [Bacillus sp. FJAT-49736]MBS4175413.1 low molecular weight protein arginine phosphatase [Bacillus sp. FJAT-49736]